MHHITQTVVTFDLELQAKQIGQFRGAMAQHVGYEHELFHNHDNSTAGANKYHHRYPLLQYIRADSGEAQLLGLGEGAEALKQLLHHQLREDFVINQHKHPIKIRDIWHEAQVPIGVTDQIHRYELRDWLCIRDKYRKEWEQLDRLSERIQFLERLLANNIISMARGLGVRFERKFECYITWLGDTPKVVRRRGAYNQPLFNVQWAGNIQLPSYIGLGKGASEGYGRLLPLE